MIKNNNYIVVLIVLIGIIASFISILIVHRNFIFDDSFISYRYAKNLALGYGITWNRYEAPVEGYTNFLLVVFLAPFIKVGIDPLLTTRMLSVLSALGLGFLCFRFAKKYYGAHKLTAVLVGIAFLPAGMTFYLSTIGLETVIFTFFLFLSFYYATFFIDNVSLKYVALFGIAQLCTFLLRPEGLILTLTVALLVVMNRSQFRIKIILVIIVLLFTLIIPLAIYFTWKQLYFGTIIPNSFFLKVTTNTLYSPRGLGSIISYFQSEKKILLLILFSLTIPSKMQKHRLLSIIFICVYTLFYLRVDTLMNVYHRFLYPVTPFLFFLSMPITCLLFNHLLKWNKIAFVKISVIGLILILGFYVYPSDAIKTSWEAIHGVDRFSDKDALMQKEYSLARRLSLFKDIRQITIALGDSGVIPYFTEANIIDIVGLNDKYIARERNIKNLVDYFFSKRPTLIIYPANKDFTYVTYGHGPMGDFSKWSSDPCWDDYSYAGTVTTSGSSYDLHFLLRKDYEDQEEFASLLRRSADVVYKEFPITIGTQDKGKTLSEKQ